MLSCKETARLLSDSMETPLSLRRRMGLKFHLMMCRFCRRYAKQIRGIEKLIGLYAEPVEHPDHPASAALSTDAKERLRTALRDH